jgi:hypothetical protein
MQARATINARACVPHGRLDAASWLSDEGRRRMTVCSRGIDFTCLPPGAWLCSLLWISCACLVHFPRFHDYTRPLVVYFWIQGLTKRKLHGDLYEARLLLSICSHRRVVIVTRAFNHSRGCSHTQAPRSHPPTQETEVGDLCWRTWRWETPQIPASRAVVLIRHNFAAQGLGLRSPRVLTPQCARSICAHRTRVYRDTRVFNPRNASRLHTRTGGSPSTLYFHPRRRCSAERLASQP